MILGDLQILDLIAPAKILFPNKITIMHPGNQDMDIPFGSHHSTRTAPKYIKYVPVTTSLLTLEPYSQQANLYSVFQSSL